MNFKPELAEAVMAGVKTQTRRATSPNPKSPWWHGRCGYQPGKRFTVNPGRGKPNIGTAIVETVALVELGEITHADARAEGAVDVADFIAIWKRINGEWNPFEVVWCVTFRVDGDA